MRVFPNGFGFAILLGLAIGFASFNPALVQQWNLLGNGVLSQLIVILIFLLQGWKLDLKKLLKSLGNFDQTIRIQLGLLICPCFAVLVGDFFGWFEDDWFDAFLFLAFLPTTISSSVVYTRNAGGRGFCPWAIYNFKLNFSICRQFGFGFYYRKKHLKSGKLRVEHLR